jgi:rubrerythrin
MVYCASWFLPDASTEGGLSMDAYTLLDKCVKVEKAATSIYHNFMRLLPEDRDFWKDLFDDEVQHVSFLNDVKALGITEELQKLEIPPSIESIEKTLALAERITEKTASGPLSREYALAMALELEESIAETYVNRLIASLLACDDDKDYKTMVADEKRHIDKIRKMINEKQPDLA